MTRCCSSTTTRAAPSKGKDDEKEETADEAPFSCGLMGLSVAGDSKDEGVEPLEAASFAFAAAARAAAAAAAASYAVLGAAP
jgi:hypothetical protein